MTPETKIPVYRREVAPGIGFTTFSAEGTTLLGWIVTADWYIPIDDRGHTDSCVLIPVGSGNGEFPTADHALAYACAGVKGLRFEEHWHTDQDLVPFLDKDGQLDMAAANRHIDAVNAARARNAEDMREKTDSPQVRASDVFAPVSLKDVQEYAEKAGIPLWDESSYERVEPKPETWRDRKPLL